MKRSKWIALVMLAGLAGASAQVASHATTGNVKPATAHPANQVSDRPVVRVNGAVLTDRDLLREMFSIFPYAQQHGGTFPKAMEPEIRRGALEMIIFEELVYQEAQRRKVPVPAARLDRAIAKLRAQFAPGDYDRYLASECEGSTAVLRQRIRRSMMIEAVLKSDVEIPGSVSAKAIRSYYEKHPAEFQRGESFSIQTISIIPPRGAGDAAQSEARKRGEDALRQAKKTNSYREFGLLAEKTSDDDWHVNMGDRHAVSAAALPPPIVQAARKMKPGQVSDLIQLGPNYTLFRLNAHTPAGRVRFEDIQARLASDLQKANVNRLRSELNRKLHKNAKIEMLARTAG